MEPLLAALHGQERGQQQLHHCETAWMLIFLPSLSKNKAFAASSGVNVETRDISLASRVLANFPDALTADQQVDDALSELGVRKKEREEEGERKKGRRNEKREERLMRGEGLVLPRELMPSARRCKAPQIGPVFWCRNLPRTACGLFLLHFVCSTCNWVGRKTRGITPACPPTASRPAVVFRLLFVWGVPSFSFSFSRSLFLFLFPSRVAHRTASVSS